MRGKALPLAVSLTGLVLASVQPLPAGAETVYFIVGEWPEIGGHHTYFAGCRIQSAGGVARQPDVCLRFEEGPATLATCQGRRAQ